MESTHGSAWRRLSILIEYGIFGIDAFKINHRRYTLQTIVRGVGTVEKEREIVVTPLCTRVVSRVQIKRVLFVFSRKQRIAKFKFHERLSGRKKKNSIQKINAFVLEKIIVCFVIGKTIHGNIQCYTFIRWA